MFNYNLIGFEDKFYTKFQRPKILDIHHKRINEINNRKNKFKSNPEENVNKNNELSKSNHKKRKSSFIDAENEYNKDYTNFIIAKRLIDISNRDIAKSGLSHIVVNPPFLEMKKSIKKNLDKFKEKQICKENFDMFKRLSNQQSSFLPKIFNTSENVKNNNHKIIKRRDSSKSKNVNSTVESYSKNKRLRKKSYTNEEEIYHYDQTVNTDKSDLILPNIYLRELIANGKKNQDKNNKKDIFERNHRLSPKNMKKVKNSSEVDYIKFDDGMIII